MVVLLGLDLGEKWLARVQEHLADEAMVLSAGPAEALELIRRLPVAVLVADLEPLTADKLLACARLRQTTTGLVTVYLGPDDVREQLAAENQPEPDFWVDTTATYAETGVTLRAAVQQSRYVSMASGGGLDIREAPPAAGDVGHLTHEQETLLHLMSALAGNTDLDRLLSSYVETAAELTRCASYCFLWREAEGQALRVRLARGMHPQVEAQGRLSPSDALPEWYRHSSRVLTLAELAQWSDVTRARALATEMAVFRGQVVVPLLVQGHVCGLLLLGEKVVGDSYGRGELETLFLLSGMVAVQVQNLQLQDKVHDTKAYLEQSLGGMQCGLLTMGPDSRLVFCNPYAARALGTTPEELRGSDLRNLPSPLGDYLYAAFREPEAAVFGAEVTLVRSGVRLRVSTAPMTDDHGQRTGSVMLMEDITAPEADRDQATRKETLQVLSSIVGRLAHQVRTPLTAIRTYAQLMGQNSSDDGLQQFWEQTVRPELERLEHLVDEQLKLLQQPEPQFQLVSLEALVRDAGAELCLTMPEAPPPEIITAMDLPEVVADPVAAREALVYLMRHLRRVCSGGLQVRMQIRNVSGGPRVEALLSGLVTGGATHLTNILDPLHALQQAEGDLGPAISRQIIEKQGGRVEAGVENGRLEFHVSFPVLVTRRPETSGVHANG